MLSEVWAGNSPVSVSQVGSGNADFYAFPDFFRGQSPGPAGAYYYNGDLIGDYAGSSTFAKSVNAAWVANGGNAGWVPLAERGGVATGTAFLPSEIVYSFLNWLNFDRKLQIARRLLAKIFL